MRKQAENSANNWWERSPNYNNSNNFCNVNSDGSANNNNASNTNGLAPFGYIIDTRKVASAKLADFDTGACCPRPKGQMCIVPPLYEIGSGVGLYDMGDYEKISDFGNLLKAANACGSGVRWKASVQAFEITKLRQVAKLKKELEGGAYRSKGFHEFTINERGKTRRIQSVHISERCVQKSLCNNVMKPAIVPKLVYDNSASLKGKGTEFALNRLKCHLERHYRKHGRKGGILTIDFKNYFGSIDHDKLLRLLSETFPDKKVYDFLSQFVTAFDEGLGLGSETSQISAIYFPNAIDHMVKEKLHIRGYGRYMDDSYLIHEDIDHLRYCLDEIEKACEKQGITINRKRTMITPLTKGFTFLKKRVYLEPNGRVSIRLSRKNITARRRKLRHQRESLDDGKITMATIAQSYQSWRGYALKYDSYNTVKNMDKLYHELFGVKPGEEKQWTRK